MSGPGGIMSDLSEIQEMLAEMPQEYPEELDEDAELDFSEDELESLERYETGRIAQMEGGL